MTKPAPAACLILALILTDCSCSRTPARTCTIRLGDSDIVLNVQVAATPEQRAAGLSGRTGLPDDAGMLFIFPEPNQPG